MTAFEFIEGHRDAFRLDVMCRMLGVTKSGYFTWRGRPTSTRKIRDAELKGDIERIHARSKGRYGVPRVHAELRAAGRSCSRRRVARLMHEAGLRGKVRNRYKSTTQADPTHPPAQDLVKRNIAVAAPNTVWAVDMSYLPTKEGWLYLAVVLDLHWAGRWVSASPPICRSRR